MTQRWRRAHRSATAAASTAATAAPARGRSVTVPTALAVGTAGVLFDVHFLETGVAPPVGILFLDFEQFFIPRFVRKGPGLSHHVVDFLAFASRVTGIINPGMSWIPIHTQLAGTAWTAPGWGRTPPEPANGGHITIHLNTCNNSRNAAVLNQDPI